MTVERTEVELRKAQMVKVLRSTIRLKYSLMADEELNEVLPAAEKAFDQAVHQGILPGAIDVESIARSAVPG